MKTLALDSLDSSTKDESDSGNKLSADESENKAVTNGLNGSSNKVSSPAKIPVINSGDMNYIVMMNNGTQKHKNKIKKHCNLM